MSAHIPVQGLASALHSAGSERRWVLMLRAYTDDSAGPDLVAYAGFIGTSNAWQALEAGWLESLRGNPQRPAVEALHMKRLSAFKGGFKGWTEPQRRELLGELLE